MMNEGKEMDKKLNILVAEDDRMSRAFITEFMTAYGSVDAATNGMEAVDLFIESIKSKKPYDLLCLDIMMPKVDGIGVLKAMRENNILTPVLLLTAKTEVDDKVAGLDAGADDYLAKPFDMRELLARVRALVRRGREYNPLQKIWASEPEANEDTVWLYISYLKRKLSAIDSGLTIEGERGGNFKLLDTQAA